MVQRPDLDRESNNHINTYLFMEVITKKQARKLQDAQAEKLTSLQANKLTSW